MASRCAFLILVLATVLASEPSMPQPRFTADNQLIRPEGYREWMFVGSNLNMGYAEGPEPTESRFHNIYIQREAYRQFAASGRFPDKTILVMEVIAAGTNASINKRGQFEDRTLGIEVAMKDQQRFPEQWAYFNFIGKEGAPLAQAKAFPKEACWKCHNQHGAADNVFVQFYPVLREARPK
ncbi:MAG: cytochrome P460 family protein [Acidobacteria bacterium]|nr:cytochrome P460 family protein [Acidobacteriota bacterium]